MAGSRVELALDVIARDKASRTFDDVGASADKAEGKIGKLSGSMGKVGGTVGAAAGLGLGAAFASNLSLDAANDKLSAQLGLTEQQSAKVGKTAGSLYANAYGDSLEDVNGAIRSVVQDIGTSVNSVDLEPITGKVMSVATAFDQDLGGVTRAVGQLMRTGLAKNAGQALDIITRGFQTGANKADDFLDTLNEYGTQFRKVGIDGATATGLISQGLRAGARDGDLVADAIKEFSIRAIDGSESTSEAYKGLGLDAKKMTEAIAAGGPAAKAGLGEVLNRLRAVKDPAKQAALATGLFGTQSEDLGKALYALDPAAAGLGKVSGAATALDAKLSDNVNTSLTAFKRQAQEALVNVMGAAAPKLQAVAGFVQRNKDVVVPLVAVLGSLGAIVWSVNAAQRAYTATVSAATVVKGLFTGATVTETAATEGAAVAQRSLNLAFLASPVGLIIAGLIALGVGLVVLWKKSETFRNIVKGTWDAVKGAFVGAWNALKNGFGWLREHWPLVLAILTGPIGLAVLFVSKHFDQIVGFVKGMPGRIGSAAHGMWDGIKNAFRSAINWMIAKWNGLEFTLPKVNTHIPGVGTIGGWTLGTPDIPMLAKGGTITRAGAAIVGERGPELLSHVPQGASVIPLPRHGAGGRGGDTYVTINLYGPGDRMSAAREVEKLLTELARTRGTALAFG